MERLSCLSAIRISVFSNECCVLGVAYRLPSPYYCRICICISICISISLRLIEDYTTGPERL